MLYISSGDIFFLFLFSTPSNSCWSYQQNVHGDYKLKHHNESRIKEVSGSLRLPEKPVVNQVTEWGCITSQNSSVVPSFNLFSANILEGTVHIFMLWSIALWESNWKGNNWLIFWMKSITDSYTMLKKVSETLIENINPLSCILSFWLSIFF